MKERILEINPKAEVKVHQTFFFLKAQMILLIMIVIIL